jgi:hypothetical protein
MRQSSVAVTGHVDTLLVPLSPNYRCRGDDGERPERAGNPQALPSARAACRRTAIEVRGTATPGRPAEHADGGMPNDERSAGTRTVRPSSGWRKAPASAGWGCIRHQPAAADEHLGAAVDYQRPRRSETRGEAGIDRRARPRSPWAMSQWTAPRDAEHGRGVVRADDSHANALRAVRAGEHADAVARRHEDLRVESRQDPRARRCDAAGVGGIPRPTPGSRGSGWKWGSNIVASVAGRSTEPWSFAPPPSSAATKRAVSRLEA